MSAERLPETSAEQASERSARESGFRLLFGAGTTIFLFGTIFAQTKSPDRTPDLIIFAVAAAIFAAALFVGQVPRRTKDSVFQWRSGLLSTGILLFELVISLSFIRELISYGFHRR